MRQEVKKKKKSQQGEFLGVLTDCRLSIKNQVSSLQKQMPVASGMLKRVSRLVPIEAQLKADYALIYSKLVYGIMFWSKSYHGNKVKLER